MSEDLPDPESRVTLKDGEIVLNWTRTNWASHEALVAKLKAALRRAGFPMTLSKAFDRRTPSHQCGTARMGTDPETAWSRHWGGPMTTPISGSRMRACCPRLRR
jgi:choline dehydrogenase-like flavoprotein